MLSRLMKSLLLFREVILNPCAERARQRTQHAGALFPRSRAVNSTYGGALMRFFISLLEHLIKESSLRKESEDLATRSGSSSATCLAFSTPSGRMLLAMDSLQ